MQLLSDITFVNPILQAARMHAKVMPNATYLYTFSYEGPTLLRQFLEVVDSNGKTGNIDFCFLPMAKLVSLFCSGLGNTPWR